MSARDETLRYVEQQIMRARMGNGGQDGTERARVAWITVDHFTARPTEERVRVDPVTGEAITVLSNAKVAGDPLLHTHALLPNLAVTESGRFASIDTAAFHGRIKEFGAVYHDILARELRGLGVEVDMDPTTLLSRLPAIPQRVVNEFSKRTRDANDDAKLWAAQEGIEWEGTTPDQRAVFAKIGAHATRRDKETNDPDMTAWRAQAERLGWQHTTVITEPPGGPVLSRAQRMEIADREGLAHLAGMLAQRAVVGQGDARLAAARGFLVAGIDGTDDIGTMMKHWADKGVVQDGRWTRLLWREDEQGRVRITTELHRDQELELIAMARRASDDRRLSFSRTEMDVAIRKSGVAYAGEHGAKQRQPAETLGTDGALAVLIGVGGAGKTKGILPPIVRAATDRGLDVVGIAQQWRQARELEGSGIEPSRVFALQPFLDGVRSDRIPLRRDSVVFLDEIGQVGTRQLLDLARLRDERGFKVVGLGDDKQCAAIEAGPVVDLLRQALGEARVPQILSTVRQQSLEEQRISLLFRDGKAQEAVQAKIDNGTAELVPGGYRDAVQRVAAVYAEQRGLGHQGTISAPTNVDAREISQAVRQMRRDMGELGPDQVNVVVTDARGGSHVLDLAVGDRVRLFAATRGVFTDEGGRRKSASVGDNGSVLTVVGIDRHEGLQLQTNSGKVAFVSWQALRYKGGSDRLLLAHGDVLTIDSSQGMTSDVHIDALPAGSKVTSRGKAYVAQSRHRMRSFLIGSMGAEMREVRTRRMSGLPPMTQPEETQAAWANLVRYLARDTRKESALELLSRTVITRRSGAKTLQSVLRRHQAREQVGQGATTVRQTAAAGEARRAFPAVAERVAEMAEHRAGLSAFVEAQTRSRSPGMTPLPEQRALHESLYEPALSPQELEDRLSRDLSAAVEAVRHQTQSSPPAPTASQSRGDVQNQS